MFRKYLVVLAALAGLSVGVAGTAFATGTFDNSTPPPLAPWEKNPCLDSPTDSGKQSNCFINSTMGMTPATAGFKIRKIPNQPLKCYFFSDQTEESDMCYSTTTDVDWFLNHTFYLTNDRPTKHRR